MNNGFVILLLYALILNVLVVPVAKNYPDSFTIFVLSASLYKLKYASSNYGYDHDNIPDPFVINIFYVALPNPVGNYNEFGNYIVLV